jgi:hypothetical protein
MLFLPSIAPAQVASHTAFRVRFGAALPATCNPATGDIFWKNVAPIGIYQCLVANTWTAGVALGPMSNVDANTVQQVNGTNTQILHIYDTFIDAANYRRFSIGTGGGNYFVDLQKLGSPGAKDLFLGNSTGGRTVFRWGPGNALTGETNGSLTWGNSKGQHFNMQAANADMSGTLTLVAGTASLTFTTAWTAAPSCVASDTAATPVAVQVTTSTTTLTLTVPGGANTDTFKYLCLGNPN